MKGAIRNALARAVSTAVRAIVNPLPGGGGFSPASLFDADTAGGVIDVRQMNRFYQDVGGMQPVTAVGQFVQSFRPTNNDVLYVTDGAIPSVTYQVDAYGPYLQHSVPEEFVYFIAAYPNKPVDAISMVYLSAGHAPVGPNYFVGSYNYWSDDDSGAYLSYDFMEMDAGASGKIAYVHYSMLEEDPPSLSGTPGLAPDVYVAGTPILCTSLASDAAVSMQIGWNTGASLDPLGLYDEGSINTLHWISMSPNTRLYGGVYMGKQLAPQELEDTKQWVNGMVKPWDQTRLFDGDVCGFWYDFSDAAQLSQDNAGAVPVTAVGQPIGYVRDKSGNNNHLPCYNMIWSALHNLAVSTENLTGPNWALIGATTITPNTDIAPDGTLTADTVNNIGADGVNGLTYTLANQPGAGKPRTVSFHLKRVTPTGILKVKNAAGGGEWNIDLAACGPDFVRITPTHPAVTVVSAMVEAVVGNGLVLRFSSASPVTVALWGLQIEYGEIVTKYQRVNTVTDYDSEGFPRYAWYNGIDTRGVNPLVDLSSTDVMSSYFAVQPMIKLAGEPFAYGMVWETTYNHNYDGELGIFVQTSASHIGHNIVARPVGAYDYVYQYSTSAQRLGAVEVPYTTEVVVDFNQRAALSKIKFSINGVPWAAPHVTTDGADTYGKFTNSILIVGARSNNPPTYTYPFKGKMFEVIGQGKREPAENIKKMADYMKAKHFYLWG